MRLQPETAAILAVLDPQAAALQRGPGRLLQCGNRFRMLEAGRHLAADRMLPEQAAGEKHPAVIVIVAFAAGIADFDRRSEEHTSELQSLMRISYAAFCLKKKKQCEVQTRKRKH